MTQKESDIGLVDKIGLKYYAFTINLLMYVGVYELTQTMEIVLLVVAFLPQLGKLLPNDDREKQANSKAFNKSVLHMIAPAVSVFQLFFMIYYTWSNYDQISHSYRSLISCLVAFSLAGGPTIDASHELIHRNEKILRLIGFIGLIPYQFTTYPIEHLYMHHKHVGTPQDDITSPKNMSLYTYFPRAIYSSYRQTFKYSKLFFAFCIFLHLTYLFVLYQFALAQLNSNQQLAFNKTLFFALISLLGLFLMESVQYIQHYGLVYRKNNQQKPTLQISSWNTVINPLYNWLTFRFQRHSDHHMNAYKVYSSLQINEKMPLFPFSFTEGVATAIVPYFWYKSADHLVDRVLNNQKITNQDIKKSQFWVRISNSLLAGLFLLNCFFGCI